MKKRIVILGSRDLCVNITEWIIQLEEVEIIGAIAPPFNGWWNDSFRKTIEKNNIPEISIDDLKGLSVDIVFTINYWKKIPFEIINIIPLGIVNIHHSYLLRYKGRYTSSWAIINARKDNYWKHGTTLHYIDDKLDEGKIIDSRCVSIEEDDTAETIFQKVEYLALNMFKENFHRILDGVTTFIPPSKDSYFFNIDSNKDLSVEYGIPIEELYDYVRAWSFKDRPKPYFLYKGKKIYLSLNEKLEK